MNKIYDYPAQRSAAQITAIVIEHDGEIDGEYDGGIEAFWRLPGGLSLTQHESNVLGVDVALSLRRHGAVVATWEGLAADAAQVARVFIQTATAPTSPTSQYAEALA